MERALQKIRKPAVSGQFYPDDPAVLKMQVSGFLAKAASQPDPNVRALIVPHAGYPYSGAVAAEAYKTLQGRHFDFVVIIAFLHRFFLQGVFVDDAHFYETPLGRVPVERLIVDRLRESNAYLDEEIKGSFAEHSLEVQLPFLQAVLPDLRIVPVYMGEQSLDNSEAIAAALAIHLESRNALVVASTDLSHFHPYAAAVERDKHTIRMIERGDVMKLGRASQAGEVEACGLGTVIASLLLAEKKGWSKPELIRYANSGDVTGDRSSVVGYAAMKFSEKA
ncbi:MAG TPA: AmmeMemoRadiSam system protein B [Candidatus Omnitrophota bacterium]|nr:AmmeMemoRadiSam system protein B [Candidatus Omnitrophota bacterium]HPS36914.1 AmmeMemoRadiSam system protein B [Candidatus Omnitrophota bacterium]